MKRFFIFSFVIVLFSCTNEVVNESLPVVDSRLDSVVNENERLTEELIEKDSAISFFMKVFNEIEENLSLIKEKEKGITLTTKDAELLKLKEDEKSRIVEDIALINDLMVKNKQKIAQLNDKLRKSGLQIHELEKTIERLTIQVDTKDIEISSLQDQLSEANAALKHMFEEYSVITQESDEKTQKLNTAYYVFGTLKELKSQGILTEAGGFVGIGKTEKLMEDFNKSNYFTKIDITNTTSVPIYCKKAKVITIHPASSYRFEGKGKVDKLIVSNPLEFWSASKYLVIVVEQ